LIIKAPEGDTFFGHQIVRVNVTLPGVYEEEWAKKDITCLPTTIVVHLRDNINGNFGISCTVEYKFNHCIVYKSRSMLYLNTRTMGNGFKVIELQRKLKY
jgi:hypothetical protein